MYNLNRFITAKVEGKAILLIPNHPEGSLYLIGSSIETNAPRVGEYGNHSLSSLVLYPKPNEEGVIALRINGFAGRDHKGRAEFTYISAMLSVTTEDGNPWINLDQMWFSTNRIGNFFENELQVRIGDKTFSTYKPISNEDKLMKNAFWKVDGNLLCRYLFGTAHATDVLHAVVEPKLEASARVRCQHLESEVVRLESEVQKLESEARISRELSTQRLETTAIPATRVATISDAKSQPDPIRPWWSRWLHK